MQLPLNTFKAGLRTGRPQIGLSTVGLDNLPGIAATEGVDGVFFGPADPAASMGLLGKTADARVQAAIALGDTTLLVRAATELRAAFPHATGAPQC